MESNANGFDVIGDIHGHAQELKALLSELGYSRHGSGYKRSYSLATSWIVDLRSVKSSK